MHIPFNVSIRVALLLVVFLGSSLAAEDWPRFRGPNGSGISSSTGLPVEFGPDKNVVWKVELPYSYSSPIVVGKRVYVGSSDGSLYAVDMRTGNEEWRFEAGAPITASPAVASKCLVIGTEDGVLYCFGPARQAPP